MEIIINGTKVTINGATKEELKSFVEFIYGEEVVPYNAKSEFTVTLAENEERHEEICNTVAENKEVLETENSDTDLSLYYTIPELAKKYGTCQQAMDVRVKRKNNPLPVAMRIKGVRYILKEDADKHFAEFPLDEKRVGKPISVKPVLISNTDTENNKLVTLTELAKIVGRTRATLEWHVNHGMIPEKVDGKKRLFNVDECVKYLSLHTKIEVKKEVTPYTEWQKFIFAKIQLAGKDKGKSCSEAFHKMKRLYGIDLNEEKRNFYRDKGFFPKSTLETAYYVQYEQKHKENEHFENLFENCLEEVIA